MFKRVSQKLKKKEKEDELGIGEELREMFGGQETDSEESSSDSNSSGSNSDSDGDSEDEGAEDTEGQRNRIQIDDDSNSDDEDGSPPPVSLDKAATEPIYELSREKGPTHHGCIMCDGRILKSESMVADHLQSARHLRRVKRFDTYMAKVREGSTELVSSDVRQIQAMLDEETANREKAKVDAKGQTAEEKKAARIKHRAALKEARLTKKERKKADNIAKSMPKSKGKEVGTPTTPKPPGEGRRQKRKRASVEVSEDVESGAAIALSTDTQTQPLKKSKSHQQLRYFESNHKVRRKEMRAAQRDSSSKVKQKGTDKNAKHNVKKPITSDLLIFD